MCRYVCTHAFTHIATHVLRKELKQMRAQVDALSSKIKVVTSKTLGTEAERAAKPIIKKISSLWRGSLISEEEMEKIRSQRESRRTDTDRAHELYWSMYHDRLATTAAEAFGEVTEEVKEAEGDITAWKRERAGKPRSEPVSALEIQQELDDITASLSGARGAEDGGASAGDGGGAWTAEGAAMGVTDEEEIEKSAELIELEALVREQRDSRR